MDEAIQDLFLDIQHWMLENDYDETPKGKELFERISALTGVDWNRLMSSVEWTRSYRYPGYEEAIIDGHLHTRPISQHSEPPKSP